MHASLGTGRLVAGRYRLQGPVGRGAMGIVWRGRDELLHRDVAVKEVQISALTMPAEAEASYQRTLREARTAARLSHPAVVTVFDVVEEDGSPWIVMELVRGRSLEQVIAEDGPLPPLHAAELGTSLLGALAAAHAAGVLHRDVKPSNVLITADRRAILTDFGIATFAADPGMTQAGMVVGTPGFTAPERIRGQSATPASDLWSLGATLYAAVEGRGPFDRPGGSAVISAGVTAEEPPRAPSAGPLAPVIDALLRRDPATRPDSAATSALLTRAATAAASGPRPWRQDFEAADSDLGTVGLTPSSPGGAGLPDAGRTGAGPGDTDLRGAGAGDAGGRAACGNAAVDAADGGAALEEAARRDARPGSAAAGGAPADAAEGGAAPADGAWRSGSASGRGGVPAGPTAGQDATAADPAASFLDPPVYSALRMPGDAAGGGPAPAGRRPPGAQSTRLRTSLDSRMPGSAAGGPAALPSVRPSPAGDPSDGAVPPGQAGAQGPRSRGSGGWSRYWRVVTVAAGIAAIAIAAVLGFGIYSRSLTSALPSHPVAPGVGQAGRASTAARQRPAAARGARSGSPLSGGGSAGHTGSSSPGGSGGQNKNQNKNKKPDPVTSKVPRGKKPGGTAPPSPAPSASPLPPPPAGYQWYQVTATALGATAGFVMAVPDPWQLGIQGQLANLHPQAGLARITVNVTPFRYPRPVREARSQQAAALAAGTYPGYRLVSIKPTEFMGQAAANWRFTWKPAGVARTTVETLLVTLPTEAGRQAYALRMSAPSPRLAAIQPVYQKALSTFRPLPPA